MFIFTTHCLIYMNTNFYNWCHGNAHSICCQVCISGNFVILIILLLILYYYNSWQVGKNKCKYVWIENGYQYLDFTFIICYSLPN